MYAIFYKDTSEGETSFRFRALMENKKEDIFVKKSIEVMGWDINNIKAYYYEDLIKCENFKRHRDDDKKLHALYVNPNNYKLEKILITKEANKAITNIPFDHENALDYYTQDQIDAWTHNALILESWNTDNPNPDENTPEPDFLGIEWPEEVMDELILEAEEYQVLDSITATVIDIDARIAEEEQALADGKKKLD